MIPTEVSGEAIRSSAAQLTTVTDDIDSTVRNFQSTLESLGQPWGSDELGMIIGGVYQAAMAMMVNCYNSNVETMDGYAERLGLAADNYDEADSTAAARLNSLHASPGANFAM